MVGGGVETAIEGDEFAGMLHTDEHFASGFVVVTGGGQDGFDVTGFGTFVQKLEDSTTVRGADGAGTQAMQESEIGDGEPAEQGLVMIGGDGVGEWGWCGA